MLGPGRELRGHADLGLCPISVACCVALGKSLNFSAPHFHFLYNESNGFKDQMGLSLSLFQGPSVINLARSK